MADTPRPAPRPCLDRDAADPALVRALAAAPPPPEGQPDEAAWAVLARLAAACEAVERSTTDAEAATVAAEAAEALWGGLIGPEAD